MLRKDKNAMRRSREISPGKRGDGPVVCWLDRDQRLHDNWALLVAQQEAAARDKPLLIIAFAADAGEQFSSQQSFLQGGLALLREEAMAYRFGFHVFQDPAEKVLPTLLTRLDGHLLVTDFSPLRRKRKALEQLCRELPLPVLEVDSHNIIPCWTVSAKKEYAAYTLRPKIHRLLDDYLTDFPALLRHPIPPPAVDSRDFAEITATLGDLAGPGRDDFPPGCSAAKSRMEAFIADRLEDYDRLRNDPLAAGQSNLSPYLHAGHLAPQRLALAVRDSGCSAEARGSFLEELVVRRELADNYCYYEPHYDDFRAFPEWARSTLDAHRADRRRPLYTADQLAGAETHEELWNCCQSDLVENNKLHGFLRMYWAKKILEWSASPEEALSLANRLNDSYSLDGNDPNGYAGTAWSIGGVHDRAWPEREIFGKIRYMNEKGCRRKFKVDRYIAGIKQQ